MEEFKDIYLRPYIRLAMRHTYLSEYHLDRSIWDHEIIFIEKGSLRFIFDDKEYVAHENECVILRPRMHHRIEWNGVDCEQPHVHFDFFYRKDSPYVGVSMLREDQMSDAEKALFREDFYTTNGIDIPTVIHLNEPYVVRDLLHRIIDEFTYKMPYSNFFLQGSLIELIATIFRDYHQRKEDEFRPYSKELNDLVNHMVQSVDEKLTLDDFARETNFSKWNLIQLFKRYYNTTPIKYYNRLRYNRAKNLLMYSYLSVKEITYKMNFHSPQSFSRWFKSIDGQPPSTYLHQVYSKREGE